MSESAPAPQSPAAVALMSGQVSRRAAATALLRSAGVVAATLVVYALLPIREETALAIGAIAALGMAVLAVVFVRQLRRVSAAASPLAAAVEALALVFGMFLTLFSFVYVSIDAFTPESFTQPISKVAGVYFSVTVLATVGFGDISPVTDSARILVTIQMVLDLALIGAAVKLLGFSARRAVDARQVSGSASGVPVVAPMSAPAATLPEQADEDLEGRM